MPESIIPAPVINVLIVEDDEVEIMGLRRVLRAAETPHTLSVARDGMEALQVLRGEGQVALGRPTLVFMDLNMPRMNGLEFLRELRSDPELAHTDVVVVTTSSAAEDQRAAWRSRVAGYIVKTNAGTFDAYAQEIDGFLRRSAATHGRLCGPLDALVLASESRALVLRAALAAVPFVATCGCISEAITALQRRAFDCMVVDTPSLHDVAVESFLAEAAKRCPAMPAIVLLAPLGVYCTDPDSSHDWTVCAGLDNDALYRSTVDAFTRRRRESFLTEDGSGVQVRVLLPNRERSGSRS